MSARPLVVGIAGGSGSGKTTAAHTRAAKTITVQPRHVVVVEGILIFGDGRLHRAAHASGVRRALACGAGEYR